MLLTIVSGWAGPPAAWLGAGRLPGCRAAWSESLHCDLTGPADTPGLGPARRAEECCPEHGHTSLHSQYTRLSRKPRGASLKKLESAVYARARLLSLPLACFPRVPYT